jgi:NADH:ubiquinone oxidoreductase subunit E
MQKPSPLHHFVIRKIDEIYEKKDTWFVEDAYRHVAEYYGITTEEVGQLVDEFEAYEEAMAELEYNR